MKKYKDLVLTQTLSNADLEGLCQQSRLELSSADGLTFLDETAALLKLCLELDKTQVNSSEISAVRGVRLSDFDNERECTSIELATDFQATPGPFVVPRFVER